MRSAIYCRVSTDKQEHEGTSLDTQGAACREEAAKQGLTVADERVYRETWSGKTRERPQLTRLREAVRGREIDAVIVYAVDRLSRNQTDIFLLLDEMDKANVLFICVTEPFENTPMGKAFLSMRAAFGEMEREKIKERVTRGRIAKAKAGKIPCGGHTAYGWTWIKGEGRREPHPEQSKIVIQMFHWVADEGLTLYGVQKRLHERGVTAPDGGEYWNPSSIRRIIKSPAYTGRTIWDGIEVPGASPAIISVDLYDRAQEQIKRNLTTSKRNAKRPYLLSGLLVCSKCGRIYRGTAQSYSRKDGSLYERRTYRCGGSDPRVSNVCDGKLIVADEAEAAVWDFAQNLLRNPALIVAELERQRDAQDTTEIESEIDSVRKSIERVDTRKQRIASLTLKIEDDDEREAYFKRERAAITADTERLRADEQRLVARKMRDVITSDKIADIEAFCARWCANLGTLTADEKRRVLSALNFKVTVEEDGTRLLVEGYVPCGCITLRQSNSADPARSHRRATIRGNSPPSTGGMSRSGYGATRRSPSPVVRRST